MKTKLLIIALLVSVSATAQVRNYKANQHELLNSFESGQISKCSGLRANLELVFEKDILQYRAHDGYLIPDMVVLVVYDEKRGCWGYKKTGSNYIWPFCEVDELQRDFLDHCTVIGNLIDNPELTR